MKCWWFAVQGEAYESGEGAAEQPDHLAQPRVASEERGAAGPLPAEGQRHPGAEMQAGEQGRRGVCASFHSHKSV